MAERQLPIVPADESPASSISPRTLELVRAHPRRLSRWPRRIVLLFVCLWLVDAGVTVLIRYTGLQAKLTARLSGAFGRPVKVGRYEFSLWTGPVLEAQSVTVGEDPRFGDEYFLRADSLKVRLSWQSLLRGQLELGTLSLSQPSLNAVRNSTGDWNLAEWLPRPNQRALAPWSVPSVALRFRRIQVEGGRLNFKLGNEKLPVAFVGVNGTVEADGPGRWRMDLKATPWRVSTLTQQAGDVHVAGRVGGTSSRLLPALLELSWTNASISDALRLARGYDYGIRGKLGVMLSAHTANGEWDVRARAEMRQLHQWNLALRPDNPDLNFVAQMTIHPETSELTLSSGTLEAPRSNARLAGRLVWAASGVHGNRSSVPFRVEVSNSMVDFSDVLAWLRAFHAGLSDRIAVQGEAGVSGVVSGWPLRLESVAVASEGARLAGLPLRDPVRIAPVDLFYDADHFSLAPVTLSMGSRGAPPDGAFRIETAFKPGANHPPALRLTGGVANADDLVAVASMLGWNFSRGWGLGGAFRCDLRWQGTEPWRSEPVGFVELGGPSEAEGASLRAPFLNHPLDHVKARVDFKPETRHVLVSSARAFGARWTGTLDRREADRRWQFLLSADHLAAADLDRWLNPRWRETLIDRMLPFLNPHSSVLATPENLQANGRLNVDELTVAAMTLQNVRGSLELAGRHVELTNTVARFYGGELSGLLVADLKAVPAYRSSVDFSNVDLAALTSASPGLAGVFGGSASGKIILATQGATRADLVRSFDCEGSASMNDAEFHGINLADSLREALPRAGASVFARASAAFVCGDGKVRFQDLTLADSGGEIEGSGAVDFGRNLDLQLEFRRDGDSPIGEMARASTPGAPYQVRGTLASPQIARIESPSRRAR